MELPNPSFLEEQAAHDLGSDGQPDVITDQHRKGAQARDEKPIAGFVCPSRRPVAIYNRPKRQVYFNGTPIAQAGVIDYAANW